MPTPEKPHRGVPQAWSRDRSARLDDDSFTDPSRTRVDDELLAVRVHNRLILHLKFEALPVRVTAAGGVISLSGAVDRRSIIDRAQSIAESVDGVVRVKNQLAHSRSDAAARPWETNDGETAQDIEDTVLETRIRRKLVKLLGAGAFHIGVVASDGMIVLSGDVPDTPYAEQAVRIAGGVNGVEEVHDLLTIHQAHAKH
jgi:osmotically-inducible protein OsmY